jgi:DNA-binding CsgD family transcriptional regulator
MVAVPAEVVGREEELEVIEAFLVAIGALPATLVLEGEAGIGKTTLFRHAITRAERHGYRALSCAPAEAESPLSFAAVADLLRPVADETLSGLPEVQKQALAGAVFLEEEGRANRHAVAAAFLGALRLLAVDSPLLLAVDDLQWLDSESSLLLTFATRRLHKEPIALLAAARPGAWGRLFGNGVDVRHLQLEPLSLGALQRLFRTRHGLALPRPLLRELHTVSGGNPFFALELVRALPADRAPTLGDLEATLPETVEQLVTDRLRRLPSRTRSVLAELAAGGDSIPLDVENSHLDPGLAEEVVVIRAGRVEFAHPLLRAAAYAQLSPSRRRAVHARISRLARDPVGRARHLALATEAPDEARASRVEQGAWEARRRGGPAVAAELFEEARRLSVSDESRWARTLAAATSKAEAGDLEGARAGLETLLEELPQGLLRARVLAALADDIGVEIGRAAAFCAEGLAQPGVGEGTQARLLLALSDTVFLQNDMPASRVHARRALALAVQAGDKELEARAASWLGQLASFGGDDACWALFERAHLIEEALPAVDPWRSAGHWRGVSLMWADHVDEARPFLREQLARAIELGNEWAQSGLLFHLVQLECRAGDLARAARDAAAGLELADLLGASQNRALILNARALVAAHLGRADEARPLAEAALEATARAGDVFFPIHHRVVLGFLECSLGDHAAAHAWLEGLEEQLEAMGVRDPGVFPFQGDELEALVMLGHHETAEAVVERVARRGRELDRPRALAIAWRARGMIAGARGDAEGVEEAFGHALAEHDRFAVPLERARTLLAQGIAFRRAKRKRPARESLEASLDIFERLGAQLWSARAREELKRIGGRAPASGALTPSEERIALLVAEGRSNKEVAAALFVTVRTVEGSLTKIYAKLGVRSRAELARRHASPRPN